MIVMGFTDIQGHCKKIIKCRTFTSNWILVFITKTNTVKNYLPR